MKTPTVVLIGFSTTGKSTYLKKIKDGLSDSISDFDSDEFLSREYDGHVYNIFMKLGREAIKYIESKEEEFLRFVTAYSDKPQLIAAGPFLVQRKEEWDRFVNERNPYIIHLNKSVESIYEWLIKRREKHKGELDVSNPNFGSWDDGVTTELLNGKYQDLPKSRSLENIKGHLDAITPVYENYRDAVFDSDTLWNDSEMSNGLVKLISAKLISR